MSKDSSDIIYGLHAVRHALSQSPESILEIWVQDDKKGSKAMLELLEAASGVPVQYAPRNELDKLAGYGRHQGIVIRQQMEKRATATADLEDLLVNAYMTFPLFLVLDGVQDPHNLGACLRTADAVGVSAVILPKDRAVGVNATVRKVASGAAENLTVIEVSNLARALRQMKAAGVWVVGTSDQAELSLYDADLNRPLALVMGAEGSGIRENTRVNCDLLVNIPMQGIVESLNVSVATGVCLYEALRQRRGGA